MQRLSALTHARFGLFRVRSPLLTESLLFSLPAGTEMFHFPAFPPTALYIQAGVAGHDSGSLRGFPIRTSPDQRSFTSSPGLIAGSHVLHRLLVPRHPPTALSSLSTHTNTTTRQNTYKDKHLTKMLAPTVKFSTHQQPPHPTTPQGATSHGPHRNTRHTHQGAADPSGPNSVPSPPPPRHRSSTPHTQPPTPQPRETKRPGAVPTRHHNENKHWSKFHPERDDQTRTAWNHLHH
jgi:hypothetical protein